MDSHLDDMTVNLPEGQSNTLVSLASDLPGPHSLDSILEDLLSKTADPQEEMLFDDSSSDSDRCSDLDTIFSPTRTPSDSFVTDVSPRSTFGSGRVKSCVRPLVLPIAHGLVGTPPTLEDVHEIGKVFLEGRGWGKRREVKIIELSKKRLSPPPPPQERFSVPPLPVRL